MENQLTQTRRLVRAGYRALVLVLTSVWLGGLFAFFALLGMIRGDFSVLSFAVIAVPLGCGLGFGLSPALTLCLRRGSMAFGVLFVAIPTAIASIAGGWYAPATPFAAVPASITYVVMSIVWLVISRHFPETSESPCRICSCGYDLADLRAPICPECGREISSSTGAKPLPPV